jgi:uncharacterized membrane protein
VIQCADNITDTVRTQNAARRAFVLISVLLSLLFVSCQRQTAYHPALLSGTDVVIEVAALQPEVPKFYTYHFQGRSINFFLLKVQDKILAFLDACASCYPHKQGFRYEKGCVSCRYCNVKLPVFKLEKGIGGCYPIKLEGRIENGQFRIPVKSLETAADKF